MTFNDFYNAIEVWIPWIIVAFVIHGTGIEKESKEIIE